MKPYELQFLLDDVVSAHREARILYAATNLGPLTAEDKARAWALTRTMARIRSRLSKILRSTQPRGANEAPGGSP